MKKPILIDDFTNYVNNTGEFKLLLHNTKYTFWKIVKPVINIGFMTRIYHAYLVLLGKAHAFQFFQDLSLNEQKQWVKDDIAKRARKYVNGCKCSFNCKK